MTGKQLRNSILQWAIQGKLVPQDPNDEPASVLLERIRVEKARLVKEKKIKRDKNESIIFRGEDNSYYEKLADGTVHCIDSEIPFEIPHGWKWCRLGYLFSHNTGKALNGTGGKGTPHKYLTTSNVYWNSFDFTKIKVMNFTDAELDKCTISKGDLLVCEGGDIGRAAIWTYDYDICIQNHIHRLRAYISVNTEFFLYVFLLYKGLGVIGGKGIGIQGLSSGALHNILLPIPPIKEQFRIVAKLLSLQSLIDKYIYSLKQFDLLNSSISSNLKKSILQEAVQGRLVPQIESEGTAEQLLEEIEAEKMRLVKEGKLKKSALTASRIFRGDDNRYYEQIGSQTLDITEEIQYDIPENWRWCRLGDIATLRLGKTPPRGESIYWKPEKYNWVAIGDMKDGAVITQTKEFISEKGAELFQGRISPKGSLLMSFKLTIGKISELGIDAYHNEAIITILPFFAHLAWFKYILPMIAQCGGTKDAIKGKNLNSKSLSALLIPLPPLNEQRRIIPQIQALFDKIK